MSFKAALLSGGKGGSSSSYRNSPDNLRSTDTFEMLLGLGTGRMRLAPGGLQNLFIDDVPVEDGQSKANFTDFATTLFDGDPTVLTPVKLQLGSSAGMNNINLTLANTSATAPGEWKNGAITQAGVDFIDLRFVVQQLYNQTKNGVDNATATIEVELRPSGAADWINPLMNTTGASYNQNGTRPANFGQALVYIVRRAVVADSNSSTGYSWNTNGGSAGVLTIKGKTTSPYVKELRIAVPNDGAYANKTWEIRCRLHEIDYQVSGKDGENEVHRSITWESAGGAKSDPIGGDEAWRGLSYLQVYGKATDQITGIPTIQGIYDLDLYLVPPASVWDANTRQYTGAAWDGVTTQLAWTQCPAWQIKKLIEDDLSGISALAPGSLLNKWDTLEASKWFSQLVPDGRGGTQPRYSMNWFIEQPQSVSELVNYLAGAVGSYAWDEGNGNWRLKVEKPETPQIIFTKETIAGEFTYQHTDIDTRYNDITAVFRNRENRYAEDRVRVFDQADIDATGRRATSIVLVGCDNRQEALRRAYIRLLSTLNEKRMVTFKTNRLAGLLEPFSVVGIADGDLNSNTALRSTGRIVGMDLARQKITVRDTLRLEPGVAYQVSLTIPNPDYTPETSTEPTSADWRKPTITITRNITNTAAQRGDVYDLYLDQALPTNVPEFAAIALSAPGLPALPKQYRVLGIQPDDDGEWATVSAIEIYTSKWVESDSITEDALNAQVSNKTVDPPTVPDAGMFRLDSYSSGTINRRVMVVSWVRPAGRYIDGYRVQYRYNGGPWQEAAAKTQDLFYELPDPAPGTYDFQIVTLDRRGIASNPLTGEVTLSDSTIVPPTGILTNESHTVAAAADGTGFSLAQAGGQFLVFSQAGAVSPADITFSVHANSGALATIDLNGNYTITELDADSATVTFRAVWLGMNIDKIYTIVKSKGGATGSSAKLLFLTSDRQTISFDSAGNATPAAQTINFTAQKQSTTAAVTWSILDANGVVQSVAAGLTIAGDTNSATMSVAQFNAVRNGTSGIIVKATLTDGITLSDQISVVKVSQGATGPSGPTLALNANDLSFDFIDGIAFDANQVITLSATKQNTAEALTWAASPNVTLGAPDANTRTLSIADFGPNSQVVVTITGQITGTTASVTLIRNNQTTPNDSIIPDGAWAATATTLGVVAPGRTGARSASAQPSRTAPWRLGGNMQIQGIIML